MKLAFSTLACPGWDPADIIEHAHAWGYDGIEWRLLGGGFISSETPGDDVVAVRDQMATYRLGLPALDSSIELIGATPTMRAEALSDVRAMLRLAELATAECVRIFVGAYDRDVSDDVAVAWVRDALTALAPDAHRHGVKLAVELHAIAADGGLRPSGLTCSGLLRRALADLDDDHIGVQWDVGNSVREGESIRDTWANIGDRAIYLQLKDMALGSDGAWSYVPFGEGDMPIGEILDLIVSDGFDGWLSYEWEKWWYPELAAAEDELPRFIGHIRELRGG